MLHRAYFACRTPASEGPRGDACLDFRYSYPASEFLGGAAGWRASVVAARVASVTPKPLGGEATEGAVFGGAVQESHGWLVLDESEWRKGARTLTLEEFEPCGHLTLEEFDPRGQLGGERARGIDLWLLDSPQLV